MAMRRGDQLIPMMPSEELCEDQWSVGGAPPACQMRASRPEYHREVSKRTAPRGCDKSALHAACQSLRSRKAESASMRRLPLRRPPGRCQRWRLLKAQQRVKEPGMRQMMPSTRQPQTCSGSGWLDTRPCWLKKRRCVLQPVSYCAALCHCGHLSEGEHVARQIEGNLCWSKKHC